MSVTNSRQQHWVNTENEHRQRTYRKALDEWQVDLDELTRLSRAAKSFDGSPTVGPGNPVVLKRGERVYAEVPETALVEVQRGAGHYTGGYSGFSFRVMKGVRYNVGGSRGTYVQGAEQLKVVDQGRVTITSQRIVFTGERNTREWSFAKLVSVNHDETKPITVVGVSNRQKISGLVYTAAATSELRFKLSLALAHYQDTLPAFVAGLKAELAEHKKARPAEPTLVTPEQAPDGPRAMLAWLGVALTGKKTWKPQARLAWVAAVAALVIGVAVGASGGGGSSSHHGTAASASSTVTGPVVTQEPTSEPVVPPVVVPTQKPKPKPKVTHATSVPTHHATSTPTHHATSTPTHRATHTTKPATQKPVTPACTTTSSGSCIRGGEFCPNSKDGQYGYDAEGRKYICTGDHWRVP